MVNQSEIEDRIREKNAELGKTYIVSVILTNCHTALYGFTLVENLFKSPDEVFTCKPPSLEEYLGVTNV